MPSRVERREGNYEFGEYKANIYESKGTCERSKIRYRHEDGKWRVRQFVGKKLVKGQKVPLISWILAYLVVNENLSRRLLSHCLASVWIQNRGPEQEIPAVTRVTLIAQKLRY